jgi:hypothetical protein
VRHQHGLDAAAKTTQGEQPAGLNNARTATDGSDEQMFGAK